MQSAVYIAVAVIAAVAANSASAIWASGDNKLSIWLAVIIMLAPITFIAFGLATAQTGVAVATATIDSLLTISTILIGLIAFREWDRLSVPQYAGMALALAGIYLMVSFPKQA